MMMMRHCCPAARRTTRATWNSSATTTTTSASVALRDFCVLSPRGSSNRRQRQGGEQQQQQQHDRFATASVAATTTTTTTQQQQRQQQQCCSSSSRSISTCRCYSCCHRGWIRIQTGENNATRVAAPTAQQGAVSYCTRSAYGPFHHHNYYNNNSHYYLTTATHAKRSIGAKQQKEPKDAEEEIIQGEIVRESITCLDDNSNNDNDNDMNDSHHHHHHRHNYEAKNAKNMGRLWYLQEEQIRQSERTLQLALKELRHFQNKQQQQQQQQQQHWGITTTATTEQAQRDKFESLLIQVRDAYEKLQYWDEALKLESLLYEQVYERNLQQRQQHATLRSSSSGSNSNNNSSSNDGEYNNRIATVTIAAADSLYRQGKFHMRLQHETKAFVFYHQALDLYNSIVPAQAAATQAAAQAEPYHHASKGHIYISLAGIAFHRGRLAEALEILQHQAKPHFLYDHNNFNNSDKNKNNPHPDIVKCLQHEGLIYRSMDDYSKALKAYKEAWAIYQATSLQQGSSSSLNGGTTQQKDDDDEMEKRQGMLLDIADMHAALDEVDMAREIYQQILDQDRAAALQRSKAHAAAAASSEPTPDNDDDEYNNTKSKRIEQTSALQGVMLHNLGRIYSGQQQQSGQQEQQKSQPPAQQQQLEKALALLQEALEIKEYWSGRLHPEVGKTLTALGTVHAWLARNPEGKAGADTDQANIYTAQDHYLAAKACFQRALLITRMVRGAAAAMSQQQQQAAAAGGGGGRGDNGGTDSPAEDPEVMLALHNLHLLNEQQQQQRRQTDASSSTTTTTTIDSNRPPRRRHFWMHDDDDDDKEQQGDKDKDSLSSSSSSSSDDDDDETKNAVEEETDSDSSNNDDKVV